MHPSDAIAAKSLGAPTMLWSAAPTQDIIIPIRTTIPEGYATLATIRLSFKRVSREKVF